MISRRRSLKEILRECIGDLNREVRISLTPVPKDKKWLFIVGCYNSGTTLLSELLGNHPSISALPTEGHFITDEFVKDYEIGLPRMWVEREDLFCLNENDDGPDHDRLMKEWVMRLDSKKPVFLEKSPPNSAKTRWLQKHFPNAYFVGIIRDPYAVSEGISRKGDPKIKKDGWPIEMSAKQWRRSNEILDQDSRYLNHFMWLKYEDLASDTLNTLNKVTEFCGITNFKEFENGKEWTIHERNEKIRNMNDESVSRLTEEQLKAITEVVGASLEYFGYVRR